MMSGLMMAFFQDWRKDPLNSDLLIIFVHVLSRIHLNSIRKFMLQGSTSHVVFFMLFSIFRVSSSLIGLNWVRFLHFYDGGVYNFDCWNWDLIFSILSMKKSAKLFANSSWDEQSGRGVIMLSFCCWRIQNSTCELLLLDSSCVLI